MTSLRALAKGEKKGKFLRRDCKLSFHSFAPLPPPPLPPEHPENAFPSYESELSELLKIVLLERQLKRS